MKALEALNDFHGDDKRLRAIAALHFAVEYLEDATREYKELAEVLSDELGVDGVDTMRLKTVADGDLSSAMRFLEIFKKGLK